MERNRHMADQWVSFLMRTGPNKEKQNIIWNMIGSFCYALASMVLSFLVLRIAGKEQGGIFAFGYSTFGHQMFLLAYFAIRPFHITDGKGEYQFGDYLHHRYRTCLLALFVGAGYLLISGYSLQKAGIIFLLIRLLTGLQMCMILSFRGMETFISLESPTPFGRFCLSVYFWLYWLQPRIFWRRVRPLSQPRQLEFFSLTRL